jgi:hypothetical protein
MTNTSISLCSVEPAFLNLENFIGCPVYPGVAKAPADIWMA